MLYYLAAILYILVCLALMLVVLLQQGKGGDIANAFGGGASQAAFGARSGATVLSRATTVLAALFILGALGLGMLRQTTSTGSVLGGRAPRPTTPAGAPAPTAPATPAPASSAPATPAPVEAPAPAPAK